MKTTHWILAGVLALLPAASSAALKTKTLEYKQGDTKLTGYVAWDDAAKGKRPGVLVVHEWYGHNEHARKQAERLAQAGYVGFALDLYGAGKVAAHPDDAKKFMAEATKDPAVLQARFHAALEALKKDEHVDAERLAAVGYCFGGRVALDMAQHGADLDLVATFHAALPPPAEKPALKGRVLIFNGAADTMVPADAVAAFLKGLATAQADFTFTNLPGAKHSFTNPAADKAGMPGMGYSAAADATSWKMFLAAMAETFR